MTDFPNVFMGPHGGHYRWWCGLHRYHSRLVLALITSLYERKNYTIT